jgi:aryl-alcohol dehydrogenase-like predicted oxidoreductase
LFSAYKRYSNENGIAATQEYVKLAHQFQMPPAQMALAFVNSRPFIGANIIGATSLNQLKENLESVEITLSDELLQEIELIHQRYSNPCP